MSDLKEITVNILGTTEDLNNLLDTNISLSINVTNLEAGDQLVEIQTNSLDGISIKNIDPTSIIVRTTSSQASEEQEVETEKEPAEASENTGANEVP